MLDPGMCEVGDDPAGASLANLHLASFLNVTYLPHDVFKPIATIREIRFSVPNFFVDEACRFATTFCDPTRDDSRFGQVSGDELKLLSKSFPILARKSEGHLFT